MNNVATDLIQMAVAYFLALPIGWDREQESHTAGIRTFPIVAVACCGLMLVIRSIPGATSDGYTRVIQGLITGIGFVGAGAIMRDKAGVRGTATAAAVWTVSIIGAAVGLGAYHIAAGLALATYISLRYLKPFKQPEQTPADRCLPGNEPPSGRAEDESKSG